MVSNCFAYLRPKKIPVVPVSRLTLFFSADPIIFATRLTMQPYFLWVVAGCSYVYCHNNYWIKLPKFIHRKYTSLVNIDVGSLLNIAQQKNAKTMKKIFKNNFYFRPTYPIFSLYETGTTDIFFRPKHFHFHICLIKTITKVLSLQLMLLIKQYEVAKFVGILASD
jgi:hypothetical protein